MKPRTLPRLALLAVLALAACNNLAPEAAADAGSPDAGGWRLATGKTPTTAEFAALAATCQDAGGAIEPCLTNLGLKRAR